MWIPSCPIRSPAMRVLVTVPRLNEPNLRLPNQNPMARVRNMAISGFSRRVATRNCMAVSCDPCLQVWIADGISVDDQLYFKTVCSGLKNVVHASGVLLSDFFLSTVRPYAGRTLCAG